VFRPSRRRAGPKREVLECLITPAKAGVRLFLNRMRRLRGERVSVFPLTADRTRTPHSINPLSCPRSTGYASSSSGAHRSRTPDRIRAAARIVLDRIDGRPAVVVVSAFQGVTDQLLECARLAARNDPAWEHVHGRIAAHHRSAVDSLLSGGHACGIRAQVDQQLGELRDTLQQVRALGHGRSAMDLVASFGERLSARIVASHLNQFADVEFVDARHFVMTDDNFTRASVMLPRTTGAARRYFASFWRQSLARVPVVTGFIGRTDDDRTTTWVETDPTTPPRLSALRSGRRGLKSGPMSTAS